MNRQWTYGPTLIPWKYHLHTALRLFLNKKYLKDIAACHLYKGSHDTTLDRRLGWAATIYLGTSEGLYADGVSMTLVLREWGIVIKVFIIIVVC